MAGAVILTVMIISCVAGYLLNAGYDGKYGEPAVNWGVFAAQCAFLLGALLTWPNPDVSGWFVVWCVLTIIAYIIAFIVCKAHAEGQRASKEDVIKAIIAQMIFPIGTAIVVILIIAMVLGALGGGKKKK